MAAFKYLVRILTSMDKDWPVVVANLRTARMSRIIGQEG